MSHFKFRCRSARFSTTDATEATLVRLFCPPLFYLVFHQVQPIRVIARVFAEADREIVAHLPRQTMVLFDSNSRDTITSSRHETLEQPTGMFTYSGVYTLRYPCIKPGSFRHTRVGTRVHPECIPYKTYAWIKQYKPCSKASHTTCRLWRGVGGGGGHTQA